MTPGGLRGLRIAALALAPVLAAQAERPVDTLRQAILDAATAGAVDPLATALSPLQAGSTTELDIALADATDAPLADCLAHIVRPPGVPLADWQALARWPGTCDRGDGEGRGAHLQLLDLDGDGRLDLVRETYVGGTGLFSQIELIRQRPDGFAWPPADVGDADARDTMTFSINGRGGDQAFDLIAIDGRIWIVYRDSAYAQDMLTLTRPFNAEPAQDGLRVRYAMRHRVAPQPGSQPSAPSLLAAVDQGLSALATRTGPAPACPERSDDAPRPWHGAGHYTFEFAATFALHHDGDCSEVTVINLLNSDHPAGGQSCCMAWVYDRQATQIAEIALTTERRLLAVDIVPASDIATP
ncbi:hypothetical protein [Luteimonas sp. RC10]|uniref:hypothetical protein n=1 Tax=Luteimonas sp. RC10 TaxID=2587035 RepID=UPI0016155316|nr:hypothetical protein [Luteimonas sp. RC10]MBB3344977.1 hypothetical protein [Luteimonas sp. RC10]